MAAAASNGPPDDDAHDSHVWNQETFRRCQGKPLRNARGQRLLDLHMDLSRVWSEADKEKFRNSGLLHIIETGEFLKDVQVYFGPGHVLVASYFNVFEERDIPMPSEVPCDRILSESQIMMFLNIKGTQERGDSPFLMKSNATIDLWNPFLPEWLAGSACPKVLDVLRQAMAMVRRMLKYPNPSEQRAGYEAALPPEMQAARAQMGVAPGTTWDQLSPRSQRRLGRVPLGLEEEPMEEEGHEGKVLEPPVPRPDRPDPRFAMPSQAEIDAVARRESGRSVTEAEVNAAGYRMRDVPFVPRGRQEKRTRMEARRYGRRGRGKRHV